ncbi:MAG: beta-lactamase family protein, partial [Candidatus Pacearchaeota archaeon]|nr:beta-lactamase family protein [Candidatus Pacearchaeota archaeon]
MKIIKSPGLAAAAIRDTGLVWAGYYGKKDKYEKVNDKTLFMLASVSKTIVVVAVMQLEEKGLIKLDDDISDYLDFTVRNPRYPDKKITFRHLLTHHSSIKDRQPFHSFTYTVFSGGGDSPITLKKIITSYFSPDGNHFSKRNFRNKPPGAEYTYSNMAVSLLGYLVE